MPMVGPDGMKRGYIRYIMGDRRRISGIDMIEDVFFLCTVRGQVEKTYKGSDRIYIPG